MPLPTIADAYTPGRTFALTTTPGRRVDFRGGHARIIDERDIPHILRIEGAVLVPDPRYVDWVPQWCRDAGERPGVRARIDLPEGWELGPAPDYELTRRGWEPVTIDDSVARKGK